MLIVAYELGVTQSKYIKNTKTETNEARCGSGLETFYNEKWGFVYTVRKSLVNWPLSRGY